MQCATVDDDDDDDDDGVDEDSSPDAGSLESDDSVSVGGDWRGKEVVSDIPVQLDDEEWNDDSHDDKWSSATVLAEEYSGEQESTCTFEVICGLGDDEAEEN